MKEEYISQISVFYNDAEIKLVEEILASFDEDKLKEILELIKHGLSGKQTLMRIIETKKVDKLTEFLLMTFDEPEKRREILSKAKELEDTRQKGVVLKSIIDIINKGHITLGAISLDTCDNERGIVLNIQTGKKEWIVATDQAKYDEHAAIGHWITYLATEKGDGSFEDVMHKFRNSQRLGHDITAYELGEIADKQIQNNEMSL